MADSLETTSAIDLVERLRSLSAELADRGILGSATTGLAADTITRLQAALEPLALLAGDVNMHDPLSKWFTVSQLVEAAEALRSSVGGE